MTTQKQKLAKHRAKQEKTTDPETLRDLLSLIPNPEKLLGVSRVTLSRWEKGETRIPLSAANLLRLLSGLYPKHSGAWHGWRFTPTGEAIPPGWGNGLHREDILRLFFYRQQAERTETLEKENATLRRDLEFFRNERKKAPRMEFAAALLEVLNEE